jgi:hypothetical protein
MFVGRERPGVNDRRRSSDDCLHRLDSASDEGRLHLADSVIDRGAPTFVEDLHAEDLASSACAIFVRACDGDVEGQDLIGVPRRCQFLAGLCFVDGGQIELVERNLSQWGFGS